MTTSANTSSAIASQTAPPSANSTAPALAISTAAAVEKSTAPTFMDSTAGALSTQSAGSMFSPFASSSSSSAHSEPFHFAHLLPIKLTQENYLLWRAQAEPLLRSRYLFGFIDGSYPCPPERVTRAVAGGGMTSVPNPEHRAWVQQDAAILSSIVSSMTPSVSGLILFARTAEQAWSALSRSFSAQTTSQSMNILTKLAEAQKDDKSVTAYYNYICQLSDTLTSIGEPLSSTQFTAYLLKGLDADYDSLVENINGRETPLPPQELYSRLLFTEQRVSARRATGPGHGSLTDASANAVSRGRGGSSKPGYPAPSKPSSGGPLPHSNNTRGPSGGGGGNDGGGRRWHTADGNRPLCQLCNTLGHVAGRCFKRFNQDFLGIGNDANNLQRQVSMATQGRTQAFNVDTSWYMDTGATDHLTGELDKLNMKEPYQGNDRVHTANGQGPGFQGHNS